MSTLTHSYLKTEIDTITGLSNYDTTLTLNSKLDNAFYPNNSTTYKRLYEKVLVSGAPRCTFYNFSGSNDLSITKNMSDLTYTFGINNNISGLSNYYVKAEIDPLIAYTANLSNLILPDNNLTGSNKITFPLNGNFDILRPSTNSSLALFTDGGIT